MDTQSEIKSRCQELLKEQEMGRREIKRLISKAIDPARCLEALGWTFIKVDRGGQWTKIFALPYPLRATWPGHGIYLWYKMRVWLYFLIVISIY